MDLDPLDAAILRLLLEDARFSFREIAERVGSTTPTVSARVRRLESLGVVRGYRAEVDPLALGGTLHLAAVRARPATLERVRAAVLAISGVEEVLRLSGGALHVRVRLRPPATLAELRTVLAGIEGVDGVDVAEVLTAAPRPPSPLEVRALDVPCHQCKGPIHGAPVRGTFGGRAHVFCCGQCLADFRARWERTAAGAVE